MRSLNKFKWSFSQNRIRRYQKIDNKIVWESYPKSKYKHLTKLEIKELITQLNIDFVLPKKTETPNITSFKKKLETEIIKSKHINDVISMLKVHVLGYFGSENFLEWKKKEEKFGHYLLNSRLSSSRVKAVIQTTNRYIKYRHEKSPEEFPLIIIKPLSKLKIKTLPQKNTKNRLITENNFQELMKTVKDDIKPLVILAYRFGLRCSEVLGLSIDDVYLDYLLIERQYEGKNKYCNTKSRDNRMVPYWYISPEETYNLISQIKRINPNTLSRRFIKESGGKEMHDLRRSWITLSLRTQHYRDVQLAAGHRNIETTQKYIQDDRILKSVRFCPMKKTS